jgi:hypothetical protein
MGGLALLSTLSDLFASGAKAKGEVTAETDERKKLYSELESAALQRDHLRQQMRLAEYPPNELEKQIRTMEKAMGRPLTDVEKERAFGIAPKESSLKVATKLVQDANSKTGWSFVSYDPISGAEYSRQLDAPPQRGLIESETDTTDPLTGLTTVSHRKPILGAGKSSAAPFGAKPSAAAPAPLFPGSPLAALTSTALAPPPLRPGQRRQSPAGPLAAKSGSQIPSGSPAAASSPASALAVALRVRGLDADGHILPIKGVPPTVVETANELIDEKDMDKIKYAKLIPVAAALARKYGWEQGKFTPKEQTLLRESTNFIQRAMRDGSMKALDEGITSRLKLAQLIQNPEKENFIGRSAQTYLATGMSPSQQKFIQTYNQLVGTISGLAQLVRSGRITEPTIERLKAELPNPITTKDSKDAQQRLQRLLDEVNVAMRKGTFLGPDTDDPAQKFLEDFRRRQQGGGSVAPR